MPMPPKNKAQLLVRMDEIQVALLALQNDFSSLKKRAKGAVTDGLKKRDAKKVEDIRKQLGL